MEDPVRQIIRVRLEELHRTTRGAQGSWRWLSLKLRRSHSYMHQYFTYGTPQDLDYKEKLQIHTLVGIPLHDLGIILPPNPAPSPAAEALGLRPDAEPYAAHNATLTPGPNIALYRALTFALEHHRLIIRPDDIMLVDVSAATLAAPLVEGEAYLVTLYDKHDALTATPVIRQHVKPHLLITNSLQKNSIPLSTEDASQPFELVIEGRIVRVMRQ